MKLNNTTTHAPTPHKTPDAFSALHPSLNFLYFTLVLGITMLFMHPVLLGISLASGALYAVYLKGRKALRLQLLGALPLLLFTALINPVFNHAGVTILTYTKKGNPITWESLLFGLGAGAMFASVMVWFSCYHQVMTSDKFIYLFGKVVPSLSLLLSMALRFVPRFTHKIKEVTRAQKMIGQDFSQGSLKERLQHGVRILSITVTWALESAIVTADSMHSRGYGLPGRTAFSRYRLHRQDKFSLAGLLVCFGVFIVAFLRGDLYMRYFPSIRSNATTPLAVAGYLAFALLCLLPMIINTTEDLVWHYLKQKS